MMEKQIKTTGLMLLAAMFVAMAQGVMGQSLGSRFTDPTSGIRFEITGATPRHTVGVVLKAGGYSGDLVVPDTVVYNGQEYLVTSLRDSAFFNCSGLTSLTLPATLELVEFFVFQGITPTDSLFLNCNSEVPPVLSDNGVYTYYGTAGAPGATHRNNWRSRIRLTVPCVGYRAYSTEPGWLEIEKRFGVNTFPHYYDTICEYDNYIFSDDTIDYRVPRGAHTYSYDNPPDWGCVYNATLHLTVHPLLREPYNYYFCGNTSDVHCFTGWDFDTCATGTPVFTRHSLSVYGCDSTTTLSFHRLESINLYHNVCEDSSYYYSDGTRTWVLDDYETHPADTVIRIPRTRIPVNDAHNYYEPGCEQSVIDNVTVQPNPVDTLVTRFCDNENYTWRVWGYHRAYDSYSYFYRDHTYTEPGFYSDTLMTYYGCRKINNLKLNMVPHDDTVHYDTLCGNDSVLFNRQYYSTPGHYWAYYSHSNRFGCDSLETMHLTMRHAYEADDEEIYGRYIYRTGFTTRESLHKWDTTYNEIYQERVWYGSNRWRVRDGALRISSDTNTNNYNRYDQSHRSITLRYNTGAYDSIEIAFPFVVQGEPQRDYFRVYVNDTLYLNTVYSSVGFYHKYNNYAPNTWHTLRLDWVNDYNGSGMNPAVVIDWMTIRGTDSVVYNHFKRDARADICLGDSYTHGQTEYSSTGYYDEVLCTQNYGCDSTVKLHLLVHPPTTVLTDTAFCDGGSIRFGDSTFTQSTFYTDSLLSRWGCDSTLHLNLTVWPHKDTTLYRTHIGDEPYLFHGRPLTASGTYYDTLASSTNCDSAVILNLIIHPNAYTTINAEICDGETYAQNGFHESVAGTYVDSLHTIFGADSVVTLHLVVHPTFDDTISASICDRLSYNFGDSVYTATGIYTHHLHSVHGCDSLSTLNLWVKPVFDTVIYDTLRGDGGYRWYGHVLDTTGVYRDTLSNRYRCDSITELHLQIYNTDAGHIYAEICANEYFDSADFYENTPGVHSITGLYTVVGHADSVSYLHLTVHPTYNDTIVEAICDRQSFIFGDSVYSTTGIYTHYLHSVHGCDSLSTLNLWVKPVFDTVIYDTLRGDDGYRWYGHVLDSTGIYIDTLNNRYRCDSITELHLQIYNTDAGHIYAEICDNQYFDSADFYENTPGVHSITGLYTVVGHADSISYLHLSVHPTYNDTIVEAICDRQSYIFGDSVYSTTGIYTHYLHSVHGCDSLSTLNLWVKPIHDTVIYDTVRGDDGYRWYGHVLDTTGIYIDTLNNRYRCDSITELHLQIYNTDAGHIYTEICDNEYFDSADFYENTPGVHSITGLYTVVGHADSISYLHLTVHSTYNDTIVEAICDRQSYIFGDSVYSTTGIYTHYLHSVHGCDSLSTLNLWVKPVFDTVIYDTVRGDDGYRWYGHVLDTTGIYIDTLNNRYRCDSITELHLQIYNTDAGHIYAEICANEYFDSADFYENTPGVHSITGLYTVVGHADSVSYLHLTVHPTYNDTIVEAICDRQSYDFGDSVYSTTGIYTHHLHSVHGCDSLSTLNLWVKPVFDTVIYDTVRGDDGYRWYGHVLDTTGIYIDTLNNRYRCDSITELHLQIYNTDAGHIYAEICDNEYFDSADFYENTPGVHSITGLYTVVGHADSVSYLHLTVHPTYNDTIVEAICDRQSYIFGDSVYSTTGIYTHYLHSVHGCDSLSTLNLWVKPVFDTVIYDTVRGDDGYRWYGHVLDTTGIYIDTLNNRYRCDSITELHLKIYNNADTLIHDSICAREIYLLNGFDTLNADHPGLYIRHQPTVHGADSLIRLQLYHYPVYEVDVYDTICNNDFLVHHGDTLTLPGIYTDTLPTVNGCDSIITLYLTVNQSYWDTTYAEICDGENYIFHFRDPLTQGGFYYYYYNKAQNGCDSTEVLFLTVHPTYNDTIYDSILPTENYTFGNHTLYNPGFYTDSLTSKYGCDSVVNLVLTHWYLHTARLHDTICDGDSLWFNDFWRTRDSVYTDTLLAASDGMDSLVVLFLTVNPTYNDTLYDSIFCTQWYLFGDDSLNVDTTLTHYLQSMHGCDSVVTLHLHVRTVRNLDTAICMDQMPAIWHGVVFFDTLVTEPTLLLDTAIVWNDTAQRDIMLALHLTVLPNPIQTIADTIVENQLPFNFRGYTYTGNVAADTLLLPATEGCDTTTYYSLYYHPNVSAETDSTVCWGQLPFSWNGVVFNAPEGVPLITRTTTLLAHTGADSVLTMHLHVLQNTYTTRHDTIVENQLPYQVHGHIYFGACPLDTLTLVNTVGCDSVIYFRLLVNGNDVTMLDTSLCDYLLPLNWNDRIFNDPGTHDLLADTTIYRNALGADSMVIMRVHILRCSSTVFDTTLCSASLPARWRGVNFQVPQDMPCTLVDTVRLLTPTGADSLIILRMRVNETFNQTFFDTVCSNHPYIFLGQPYAASATLNAELQTRAGCDSNVVVHLKVWPTAESTYDDIICPGTSYYWIDGHTYTSPISGPSTTLRTIHGCDSVVTLNLRLGEAARAVIATNKHWVEADDQMVRLVDDTPHGRSRVWRFPDSTSNLMLVNYAYPIDYDSVRIYLTATNHDGCQDTASILLRLDRDFVWAPNAFTPDLSENSHFRIFGDGLLNVKVHIYNRAGLLVASWEGMEGSWDGKHNGIPCPQAAYTYRVTYTTLRHPRDPQQKVGSVLLLR